MPPPRKTPSAVLKRDNKFTRTIGQPGTDKPNPFAMIGEDLGAKLKSARMPQATVPPPDAAAPELTASEPEAEPPVPQPEVVAGSPGARSADTNAAVEAGMGEVAPGVSEGTGELPEAASQPMRERGGAAGAPANVVITMRIPTDLVTRAKKWAAALGLPVAPVLRSSFNRFKPELLRELRTIEVGDVRLDRPESVGHHMQARLHVTAAELADMKARLDPAGLGILPSVLNHYARDSFAVFLDGLLADAGH